VVARRAQARSTARTGPTSRPTPALSTSARRSINDRRLRKGRQGDTVEAIAPDAAALRSRHVAGRMDCGSSWALLRITAVAVVGVGRAQVAARYAGGPPGVRLPTVVSTSLAMLSRNCAMRFGRVARVLLSPPSVGFPWFLSSESRLINGLRRIQIKNHSPCNTAPEMSQTCFASSFWRPRALAAA
jgi:hypothetical protein